MSQCGLKQKIGRGETVLGVGVPMAASRDEVRAAVEQGPYDFVFTDGQHAPVSEERLAAFCAAAEEVGVPVQFRVKHTRDAYLAGNYLDLGPTGIEVPQVELAETAEEAVASVYFPPVGRRSLGGARRKRARDFTEPRAYTEWWNDHGVLWLQIESVAAAVSAYGLAGPGVDCLSFGPADLGLDLEFHPHPRLKTVDDCVAHVVRSIEGTGTAVCFRSGPPDRRQHYLDMGVSVLLESP